MDSNPELEEQTEWSHSSCWGTIPHLTPGPFPCLPRLVFHSLAEHCRGTFLFVSSPMRCLSLAWPVSCCAAMSGMWPLWEDQRLMLRATDAGGCPISFSKQLHKKENLHHVELILSGLAPTRTTSLGMLQHLWLVNRLSQAPGTLVLPPAQALDQHKQVPGSFSSGTGLRFMKNHWTHDNLNAVFWTVQW